MGERSSGSGGAPHLRASGSKHTADDSPLGFDLKTGLFGVLYTVAKEKQQSTAFIVVLLLMEWLQLFVVVVNPEYGFNGIVDEQSTAWYAISFIQLNRFISDRGYTFFLAILYTKVTALLMCLVLCIYVGYSFQNNRFDRVWPIVILRWYSAIAFRVLAIASVTLFLMALDCQYFASPTLGFSHKAPQYYNVEFPNVYCWSFPHLIHAIVASASLVVFIMLALLFTMAEMDADLLTQNALSVAHSKVEVMQLGLKVIMICSSVFISNFKLLSVIQFIMAWALVYLYVQWQPHTFNFLNHVRAAEFSSIWYITILLLVLAFMQVDDDKVDDFRSTVTLLMWAGILPAAALGACASYLRQRLYQHAVQRFRDAPDGVSSKQVHRFHDAREAEVMARCCRSWLRGWGGALDREAVDPAAVQLAEKIIGAAASQLPGSAFMMVLRASFLIDVMHSYHSGFSIMQLAKKANPNFMESFMIFSREQEHTQQTSGDKDGQGAVDLVSYVEFQRSHMLVTNVHRDSLLAMRTFWQILTLNRVSFQLLAAAIQRIDTSVRQAERVYRTVLNRHPHSPRLLKLYSQFISAVKNDPWAAAKWFAESERLEEEADKKQNEELSHMKLAEEKLTRKAGERRLRFTERSCVVIIDSSCTITSTQNVHGIFGFDKNKELYGKSINLLLPRPFSDASNTFVKTFQASVAGSDSLSTTSTQLIAAHRSHSCFPIHVTLSHLSGVGEDSMFMWVMETIDKEKDTTTAWISTSGDVLGVDSDWINWFGHRPTEIVGCNLKTTLADISVVESVMQDAEPLTSLGDQDAERTVPVKLGAAVVDVQYQVRGSRVVIPDRVMRHRYGFDVKVEVSVRRMTVGVVAMFELTFRRLEPEQMLLMCNTAGSVTFITSSLAALLGGPVESFQGDRSVHTLDEILPEPYAQIHEMYREACAGEPWTSQTQWPPYCCLSGLSVCLSSVSRSLVELPRMIPARLSVKQQELTPWEVGFAVRVQPLSLQEALDDRRLQLTLDMQGRVVEVGSSSSSLFGFDPSLLKGRLVSTFLDVFSQAPQEAQGALGSWMQPTDGSGTDKEVTIIEAMLLELAERSIASPGMSWRAGVLDPKPLNPELCNLGKVTEAYMLRRTRAAIMTLGFKGGVAGLEAEAGEAEERARATAVVPYVWGDLESEDSSLEEEEAFLGAGRRPSPRRGGGDVLFEMELWRPELSSSVLELDHQGLIVAALVNPLCPGGLVTGASSTGIVGSHIRSLVPQINSRQAHELLAPWHSSTSGGGDGGGGGGDDDGGGRGASTGPVMRLRLPHAGDGGDVDVAMQAVASSSSSHSFLVLHVRAPACGVPGLAARLLAAPAADDVAMSRAPASLAQAATRPAASAVLNSMTSVRWGDHEVTETPENPTDAGEGPGLQAGWAAATAPSLAPGTELFEGISSAFLSMARASTGGAWNFGPKADHEDEPAPNAARRRVLDSWAALTRALLDANKRTVEAAGGSGGRAARASGTLSPSGRFSDAMSDGGGGIPPEGSTSTYKQGKRFRILLNLLDSTKANALTRNAKINAIATMAVLLLIRTAAFVTMLMVVLRVQDGITDMRSSAYACRKIFEIAIDCRSLDLILEGATAPSAPGLSGPADLISTSNHLDDISTAFQQLHQGIFMGFRTYKQLPTKFGIRDMWDQPVINVTMFYNSHASVTSNTSKMSLWEAGNLYFHTARSLNAAVREAINGTSVNTSAASLIKSPNFHFIETNGPNVLFDFYKETLDGLMQVTFEYSTVVNSIHLVIVFVEGIFITAVSAAYVWHYTQKVTRLRFAMFNVFLQVPQRLVKQLAERQVDLEDDDTDYDDDDYEGHKISKMADALEQEDEIIDRVEAMGASAGADSFHRTDAGDRYESKPSLFGKLLQPSEPEPPERPERFRTLRHAVSSTINWGKVAPLVAKGAKLGFKRHLRTSNRSALWMITPFIAWAVILVTINSADYVVLQPVSSAITLLNIIDFMLIRHHICFFFALELTGINSGGTDVHAYKNSHRPITYASAADRLSYELDLFRKEYSAVLFSGESVDDGSSHFHMSDTGVAITDTRAKETLYTTKDCLCESQADCLSPDHVLYDSSRHALDGMITDYFDHFQELLGSASNLTTVSNPSYTYILTLGQNDIEGGMVKLSNVFYDELEAQYWHTLSLQIVQLVLAALLVLCFVLLMIRPLLQSIRVEKRRVAELLSQLPPEVGMHVIVSHAMADLGQHR